MRVLFVAGSPRAASRTRRLVELAHAHAQQAYHGLEHGLLDLHATELPRFRGFEEDYPDEAWEVVRAVTDADVLILGSPVFNGGYAAALKNLFEFVDYKAMEDHVAGFVLVAGGGASFLQARSQLDQLMAYFNVIAVPRGVYAKRDEVDAGIGPKLEQRLHGLVDKAIRLRGAILAAEGKPQPPQGEAARALPP